MKFQKVIGKKLTTKPSILDQLKTIYLDFWLVD